jgi:hypothetical protein
MQSTSDPEWVRFRQHVVDAVYGVASRRFVYLDENTFIGACPVCIDGTVRVFFHGRAPRADVRCSLGCAEADLARVIGGLRRAR